MATTASTNVVSLQPTACNAVAERFVVISYNLHGYNQGRSGLVELVSTLKPDAIMVQEHWLTPDNLYKLNQISDDYVVFGSSAMADSVRSGPLYGRPFGGTAILVNKRHFTRVVNLLSCDRYTAVKVANWLLITVYMPCSGTIQRDLLYGDILHELQLLLDAHPNCSWLIGGDFNTNLDSGINVSSAVKEFMFCNRLSRCDVLFPVASNCTFFNGSAGSVIDYILTSKPEDTIAFNVLDLDINLSDHNPIMAVCTCWYDHSGKLQGVHNNKTDVQHFRWDHAPLGKYYEYTGQLLQPVLESLVTLLNCSDTIGAASLVNGVDQIYNNVVDILREGANKFIPKHNKSFYKFWWSQELDVLKDQAISSCRAWKDVGKPKHGPIHLKYKQDKLLYKKCIRDEQQRETISYTNDLHDALLCKSGQAFWKCWNSKFENKSTKHYIAQIDGIADSGLIADKFAKHFESSCSPFSPERNMELKTNYVKIRTHYVGSPIIDTQMVDVELIDKLISKLANGKAAGLDEISGEHLKFSHPILVCILTKLFNFFILKGHIPVNFGASYTVPIPKCDGRIRSVTVNDFRGISISPIISKLFEMAILDRFSIYFTSSDNQFGFKKHLSCRHAIYCVRNIVESCIYNGSTANVCTIDLSKAFDRMNHFALFIKLMKRNFPLQLLTILETWFSISRTCVKWNGHVSEFFTLLSGVRQGGVLSPVLFAIFIDDIALKVKLANVGCYVSSICSCIILYADDIVLLSPTVTGLQYLLTVCERELEALDMQINVGKSMCIRFGQRFDVQCANLTSIHGGSFIWVSRCRYLGIYFVSGRTLKCSFDNAKASFYRAFNAMFSKIGRAASEETVVALLRFKCLPILLYATEACPMLSRDKQSLEFSITRLFMKIFRTGSPIVVGECQRNFNFLPVKTQLAVRTARFLRSFAASENALCLLFKDTASGQLMSIRQT